MTVHKPEDSKANRNMEWHSIYSGKVVHSRNLPRPHRFRYSLFMLLLDIDQIKDTWENCIFASYEKNNVIAFRRKNYLRPSNMSLRDAVNHHLTRAGLPECKGSIKILTHPSYCGFCFNPVSFYYCYNERQELCAIISEIENTPWGERHQYIHAINDTDNENNFTFNKDFHVSPFMPMDIEYHWNFSQPKENLNISMHNFIEGKRIFSANLYLEKRKYSHGQLARHALAMPLMTFKVVVGIYWQAFRLWLKKTPFYTHPMKTGSNHIPITKKGVGNE